MNEPINSEDNLIINKSPHWDDCQLDRFEQAELLTRFLKNNYDALNDKQDSDRKPTNTYCLNIDAEWGMGKTFFIERWAKCLENEHLVVKYNAWEHDYKKDALASLILTIVKEFEAFLEANSTASTKSLETLGALKKTTGDVLKSVAPSLVNLATMSLIGLPLGQILIKDHSQSKDDEAIAKGVSALASELTKQMIKTNREEENIIKEFKNTIEKTLTLIDTANKKLPIFIFIDELDRCRPNFCVETIECVKHFLDINGVYFIFATDAEQLQNSIGSAYGNHYDAQKYFKKVFNRECSLAEPNYKTYLHYLFSEEADFPETELSNTINTFVDSGNDAKKSTLTTFEYLARAYALDIRALLALSKDLASMLIVRSGKPTPIVVTIHLLILWYLDKKAAIKQSKSKTVDEHLIKDNFSFPSYSLSAEGIPYSRGENKEVNILDFLQKHYKCLGKNHGELFESSQEENFTIVKIYLEKAACNLVSNRHPIDSERDVLNYHSIMHNIQLLVTSET